MTIITSIPKLWVILYRAILDYAVCRGGILGIVLLKLYNVKSILKTIYNFTVNIFIFSIVWVSYYGFSILPCLCGFLTSIMYGGVFSLGMNSQFFRVSSWNSIWNILYRNNWWSYSALIVGNIGDILGLLVYVGITANTLVDNKTIKLKDLFTK